MKKIAFHTLGCKVNIYDTESVWGVFEENDYERVKFDQIADVYIINTCTVTNQSDSKSRKVIRQAIRRNSSAVVVVMGCYAQVSAEEIAKIEGVDIISGTKNRENIYKLVEEVLEERKQINVVTNLNKEFDELSVTNYSENTRAFLKIQDGCDNFCSYCIIPFARGRVVSKSVENVLQQAKTMVNKGYKEIVLSGIHTGKYGSDIGYSLTEIVKDISSLSGLVRLRISSIEINEITDELLFHIRDNKVMARHLHIPLQSGSNIVLKDMNRQYSSLFFEKRLAEIREILPGISITTDVIVGYPTESDELFEESYNFIKNNKFSELHVFPFSKRNGTKAALLKDLDKSIKQRRVSALIELNDILAENYARIFVNTKLDIIVDSTGSVSSGYTSNYLRVNISNKIAKNEHINVIIKNSGYPTNMGDITRRG